jgi:hypothetical protein
MAKKFLSKWYTFQRKYWTLFNENLHGITYAEKDAIALHQSYPDVACFQDFFHQSQVTSLSRKFL